MSNTGWIKLHRKITDHWLWEDKPFARGQAMIDLLILAGYNVQSKYVDGNLETVERGSVITSIRKLCDRWGWSNSKVVKFLKTLENDSIIHVKSDTKKTVITIVNYSVYQGFEDEKATQKRHQNDAEATHKKKVKNNNKYNNTYKNNTESNLIPSVTQESEDDTIRCDEMEQYCILAETVKQNIDYDVLLQSYPNEGQLVQGIYELIVETVAYTGKKLVIASNELPAEFVKNRFMKLNFMHIQYVISSMKKNTTEIKNIKKYLLAALYNAPATMQGYYQAEVNHAMPQYAERSR